MWRFIKCKPIINDLIMNKTTNTTHQISLSECRHLEQKEKLVILSCYCWALKNLCWVLHTMMCIILVACQVRADRSFCVGTLILAQITSLYNNTFTSPRLSIFFFHLLLQHIWSKDPLPSSLALHLFRKKHN